MKKRIAAAVLAAALMLTAFSGCQTGYNGVNPAVTTLSEEKNDIASMDQFPEPSD